MIILNSVCRKTNKALFVIEGEVRDSRSAQNIFIRVNDNELYKYPLVSGKFRAFIHLTQTNNQIELQADCEERISRTESVVLEPIRCQRFVRLVYVVGLNEDGHMDGSFQGPAEDDCSITSALSRISVAALMAQHFYSETLPSKKTFRLELNEFNEPLVHVLPITNKNIRDLWSMNQNELWNFIAQRILESHLADSQCKYLAFCSFTRYKFLTKKLIAQLKYIDLIKMTRGFVSLGGGGLALLGTQCLYTWPSSVSKIVKCLTDERQIDITKFMDDSCGRGTYAGCFASTLGSCFHEIGHTFDLGHAKQGVMGQDFHFIDEFFLKFKNSPSVSVRWWTQSASLILTHHKWFNCNDDYGNPDEKESIVLMSDQQLRSVHGIIVLEYREKNNSSLVSYNSFNLPKKIVKLKCEASCHVLAMDVFGNIKRFEAD